MKTPWKTEHLSELLQAGWSVVGYSTNRQFDSGDDNEVFHHHVLLQKDTELRAFSIYGDSLEPDEAFETVIAPGVPR
ncbi:MAG: hypothetical protein KDJ43_04680 [Rhizobiaceae bacterium]|nr:hypothetical protein [Rhizobiaceae bacterium]